ncbi:MAG: ribonuclease HII [Candidatus Aminicenantes bacterium]|nr:ribonuclease HII [Candidatus Aminicenantes bacterium]
MPDFEIERRHLDAGRRLIAGVDEAGRGALCGPVVAAAVLLPTGWFSGSHPDWVGRIDDSKRLSPRERSFLARAIRREAVYGLGLAAPAEIDAVNILHASREAMRRAVEALSAPPDIILLDGLPFDGFARPREAVVGGDRRSISIAAASILAKVCRDRMMTLAGCRYPGYGIERHKGYGTRGHYEALARLGPTPFHRKSFKLQYQAKLFESP